MPKQKYTKNFGKETSTARSADLQRYRKDIPLNGKLITSYDPLLIGDNFSTLSNMRYNDNGIESVKGNARQEGVYYDGYTVKAGYNFTKSQPEENYDLAYIDDGTNKKINILELETITTITGNSQTVEYEGQDEDPQIAKCQVGYGPVSAYSSNKVFTAWCHYNTAAAPNNQYGMRVRVGTLGETVTWGSDIAYEDAANAYYPVFAFWVGDYVVLFWTSSTGWATQYVSVYSVSGTTLTTVAHGTSLGLTSPASPTQIMLHSCDSSNAYFYISWPKTSVIHMLKLTIDLSDGSVTLGTDHTLSLGARFPTYIYLLSPTKILSVFTDSNTYLTNQNYVNTVDMENDTFTWDSSPVMDGDNCGNPVKIFNLEGDSYLKASITGSAINFSTFTIDLGATYKYIYGDATTLSTTYKNGFAVEKLDSENIVFTTGTTNKFYYYTASISGDTVTISDATDIYGDYGCYAINTMGLYSNVGLYYYNTRYYLPFYAYYDAAHTFFGTLVLGADYTVVNTDVTLADEPYFSEAPDSCVAFCDGATNFIWGGNETRCGKFIVTDQTESVKKDFTEYIDNTSTSKYATLSTSAAGTDDTVLLCHFDNNLTDSSPTTPHTLTGINTPTFSTATKKMGTHSIYFDGSQGITIPDNADFDLSGGTWTIDTWIYWTGGTQATIYRQGLNASPTADYIEIYYTSGSILGLQIYSAASAIVSMSTPAVLTKNAWNHIEISENGNDYRIFVNGLLKASLSSAERAADYDGLVTIGLTSDYGETPSYSRFMTGYLDEFRISTSCRHTSDFTPPTTPYAGGTNATVVIGATRPIQGAKFYIKTANTVASTNDVQVTYNKSGVYSPASNIVDDTVSGTTTMAQTGSITFDSTGDAVIEYKDGIVGYFYNFIFTGIDATTTVYYCTIDAAAQSIKDVWDGVTRDIGKFYEHTTYDIDYTVNVHKRDYTETDNGTYAGLGGMTSSYYILAGFPERLMGINFEFINENVNTNASILSISYWNGSAYSACINVRDGTSSEGCTFGKSGAGTWEPVSELLEFRQSVNNGLPFYYYKIEVSATLSANVCCDYIDGIPAQKTLDGYRFPIFWQNRLWLCGNQNGKKNEMICSAYGSNCVFNGWDSGKYYIGGDDELVGGATFFTKYGSSMKEHMVLFKKKEMYVVDGEGVVTNDNYKFYKASNDVGCISPRTIVTCDVGLETISGVLRHVVAWHSGYGIYMFDGTSIILISGDISNIWDNEDSSYVDTSIMNTFYGFYDPHYNEYHFLYGEADDTYLTKEKVYNLGLKKWFDISRSYPLQSGWVYMEDDRTCNHAGLLTGYIVELETGNTFTDGSSTENILSHFRLGDIPLAETPAYRSDLRNIQLMAVAETSSPNKIKCNIYADTKTAYQSLTDFSQVVSDRRVYTQNNDISIKGLFHSVEFKTDSSLATIGFKPLIVTMVFQVIGEEM